jgi:hypothetical protein
LRKRDIRDHGKTVRIAAAGFIYAPGDEMHSVSHACWIRSSLARVAFNVANTTAAEAPSVRKKIIST